MGAMTRHEARWNWERRKHDPPGASWSQSAWIVCDQDPSEGTRNVHKDQLIVGRPASC